MPSLGLLKRKEIWLPTWRGWALLAALIAVLIAGAFIGATPFLGPIHPIGRGVLIVEGWLTDQGLAEAKRMFEADGSYRLLITTGGPIERGAFIAKETNYAQLAATTLKQMGFKSDALLALPCSGVSRNRTYASARRVRSWLESHSATDPVDVFSLGVHSRRTWLLYRMALGEKHPVGIIAGKDEEYDPKRWWMTSSGVRTVTSEVIAYLYAKLLFYPGNAESKEADAAR